MAPADAACGEFDDMLDPSTSGHTGDRAGKEQVGLRKELKWCEPHNSGAGGGVKERLKLSKKRNRSEICVGIRE